MAYPREPEPTSASTQPQHNPNPHAPIRYTPRVVHELAIGNELVTVIGEHLALVRSKTNPSDLYPVAPIRERTPEGPGPTLGAQPYAPIDMYCGCVGYQVRKDCRHLAPACEALELYGMLTGPQGLGARTDPGVHLA